MDALYQIGKLREDLLHSRMEKVRLTESEAPGVEELHLMTKAERIERDIQNYVGTCSRKRKRSDNSDDSPSYLPHLKDLVSNAALPPLSSYASLDSLPVSLRSYKYLPRSDFRASAKLRILDKNYLAADDFPKQNSLFLNDALIVAVALYHPATGKKAQELLLTSSHTLKDIHEHVYCLANHMNIDDGTQGRVRPHFLIEGQKMEEFEVSLSSLTVRIGVTYKYVHRGNCHHMLLFTDLRLATDLDAPEESDYPRLIFISKTKRKKCEVCRHFHACFLTVNDPISPKSMCLMCEFCFKNLHHTDSGQLIYSDFKVLPYIHD